MSGYNFISLFTLYTMRKYDAIYELGQQISLTAGDAA